MKTTKEKLEWQIERLNSRSKNTYGIRYENGGCYIVIKYAHGGEDFVSYNDTKRATSDKLDAIINYLAFETK